MESRPDHFASLRDQLTAYHREDRLYRYCLSFLANEEAAKDASQAVFVQALEHLDKYSADASLLHWLYRICRNYCLNQLRGKPDLSLESLLSQGDAAHPQASSDEMEAVESRELLRQMRAAIEARARARKPPWDAQDYFIYEAFYSDPKKTWPEIAGILGKPVDTVKYRYYQHVLPTLHEVGDAQTSQG